MNLFKNNSWLFTTQYDLVKMDKLDQLEIDVLYLEGDITDDIIPYLSQIARFSDLVLNDQEDNIVNLIAKLAKNTQVERLFVSELTSSDSYTVFNGGYDYQRGFWYEDMTEELNSYR